MEPNRSGGSRALVSYDKKLFIKTIQNEQVAEMHRILKEYHQVKESCSSFLFIVIYVSAFIQMWFPICLNFHLIFKLTYR